MPDFERLYLDTTVLRKSNWPHISAELSFLLALARNFDIRVVIPEPAEIEREEQWIRDLTAASQKFASAASKRADVLKAIGLSTERSREDLPETLRERYLATAQSAKEINGISTAPLTSRGVREFLKLAVSRTPPFQVSGDKVTGFQDALILFSIFDDMNASGTDNSVLLSDDVVFSQVKVVSNAEGKTVQHLRTIDEVWSKFADEIQPEVVKWWQEQRAAIQTELEAQREQIVDLLMKFVSPEAVDYRARGIESIGMLRPGPVEIPFPVFPLEPGPYETKEGASFKISVTVSTEFQTIAIKGLSGIVANLMYAARSGSQPSAEAEEMSSESFWKQVEMEGTATFKEGRYSINNLTILRLS